MKFPENTARFSWTRHIKNKMLFYNISGAQILRIFQKPDRREEAIAPGTIGAMKVVRHNLQRTTHDLSPRSKMQKKRETEIWIMYKMAGKVLRAPKSKLERVGYKRPQTIKTTMISVWRYPGRTKVGERPAIPQGFMEELEQEGVL